MSTAAEGPLAGVRILDFSLLLPGPFSTQMLADLGAEVIKVEPPAGDNTRTARPNDFFPIVNRNKRSVVLDLKQEVCRRACLRIAATADVVVEGFRPGVVSRLGMSYEHILRVRPDVIYCSITGYGQTGPLRNQPGHDGSYLAASGALSYSGHWREAPRRSGIPVADLASSMYATIAILAAVHERGTTGRGGYLDVAMTDAATAFTTVRGGSGLDLTTADRGHLLPTNDVFLAADGVAMSVAAVEPQFWTRLREIIAPLEPAILEARFDDEDGRRENGDELKDLLDRVFATKLADEWVSALVTHDVPIQRVLTLAEAVDTEQAQARGLTAQLDQQRHFLFPVLRDGKPMTGSTIRSPPPNLGQHTREVLNEVGCAPDEIEQCMAYVPRS